MYSVGRSNEVAGEMNAAEKAFDIEVVFRVHYAKVARIIGRLVRDRGRGEELAVEVFLKLWRTPTAQGEQLEGWLYRGATRAALDELRRQKRRTRYEGLLAWARAADAPATPEDVRSVTEEQGPVRTVLDALSQRDAEFLLLRSQGFSYDEVANVLGMSPTSIGTLLGRAQQAFRKEYIKRSGQE